MQNFSPQCREPGETLKEPSVILFIREFAEMSNIKLLNISLKMTIEEDYYILIWNKLYKCLLCKDISVFMPCPFCLRKIKTYKL